MTCETCKHWIPTDSKTGTCEKMTSFTRDPVDKTTLAYACDAEMYEAWVVTNANFGCNMHERK